MPRPQHADSNTITAFVPYSEGVQGVWYIAISNIWEEPDADDVEHGQASGGGYKIDTRDYGMTFRLHVSCSSSLTNQHERLCLNAAAVAVTVAVIDLATNAARVRWSSALCRARSIGRRARRRCGRN